MRQNLNDLRRPRLLIRAARFGLGTYRRDRDLCRLLSRSAAPGPQAALALLIDLEARIEEARAARNEPYSTAHHVAVLTALMAEADSAQAVAPFETKAA